MSIRSRYKNLISVLAVVMLILGIIGTIIIAYMYGVDIVISSYTYTTRTVRNPVKTFAFLVAGGLITTVEYVLMRGVAECLDFLERVDEKLDRRVLSAANDDMEDELPPL